MTYSDKLKDPRWQKKRLLVLERDNWTCTECPCKDNTLHVHHKQYGKRDPWDVDDTWLCTLCKGCHEFEEALKLQNPHLAEFAKSANMTCVRLWKWLGAITFLGKHQPEEYLKLAEYANQHIVERYGSAVLSHSVNPTKQFYAEEIH